MRVVRVIAYTMIGFWFVYQFLMALSPFYTGVAYWAHIGGFVAGLALARVIRPRLRRRQVYFNLEDYR